MNFTELKKFILSKETIGQEIRGEKFIKMPFNVTDKEIDLIYLFQKHEDKIEGTFNKKGFFIKDKKVLCLNHITLSEEWIKEFKSVGITLTSNYLLRKEIEENIKIKIEEIYNSFTDEEIKSKYMELSDEDKKSFYFSQNKDKEILFFEFEETLLNGNLEFIENYLINGIGFEYLDNYGNKENLEKKLLSRLKLIRIKEYIFEELTKTDELFKKVILLKNNIKENKCKSVNIELKDNSKVKIQGEDIEELISYKNNKLCLKHNYMYFPTIFSSLYNYKDIDFSEISKITYGRKVLFE